MLLAGVVFGAVASGCNVGMAPEGPSDAQLKENYNKLSVDQKIKLIENGPIPAAEKQKQIAALKAQAGQK